MPAAARSCRAADARPLSSSTRANVRDATASGARLDATHLLELRRRRGRVELGAALEASVGRLPPAADGRAPLQAHPRRDGRRATLCTRSRCERRQRRARCSPVPMRARPTAVCPLRADSRALWPEPKLHLPALEPISDELLQLGRHAERGEKVRSTVTGDGRTATAPQPTLGRPSHTTTIYDAAQAAAHAGLGGGVLPTLAGFRDSGSRALSQELMTAGSYGSAHSLFSASGRPNFLNGSSDEPGAQERPSRSAAEIWRDSVEAVLAGFSRLPLAQGAGALDALDVCDAVDEARSLEPTRCVAHHRPACRSTQAAMSARPFGDPCAAAQPTPALPLSRPHALAWLSSMLARASELERSPLSAKLETQRPQPEEATGRLPRPPPAYHRPCTCASGPRRVPTRLARA